MSSRRDCQVVIGVDCQLYLVASTVESLNLSSFDDSGRTSKTPAFLYPCSEKGYQTAGKGVFMPDKPHILGSAIQVAFQ